MENFEEKYKYAIKQAKKELEACGSLDCDVARQIFRLFPELAESEDERIRKEIICYLDREITLSNFGGDIAAFKKWIAWLKKQSEQKTIEHKFKIGDTLHCGDSTQPVTITGLSADSYQTDSIYSRIPFSEEDKWELITSWTKEDETTLACLIKTLTWTTNNNYHCSEDIPKYMRWLENLKQRLNGTE